MARALPDKYEYINKMVGNKIQELRIVSGISREEMAEIIGVTQQQAQKYEKGINRISAGRLAAIADALGKPVSYFFEEIPEQPTKVPTHHQRMCIEVARNFIRIKNPIYQDAVSVLVRILAEA